MNNALALRPSSPLEDLMRQNNRSRELLPKEPGWTYGSILPLAERGGKYSLAIPDIVRGPINDLWSLATQWPEPGQNLSPQAIGGVLFLAAPSVATKADESTLGILAGPRAIDAPLYKLSVAKALTQGGHSPESVWSATGWGSQFAQPEGAAARWAWEIPDWTSTLKVDPSHPVEGAQLQSLDMPPTTVGDILHHPDLYRHYPSLAGIRYSNMSIGEGGGFYDYSATPFRDPSGVRRLTDTISVDPLLPPQEFHSVMLHELQHAVQAREGWPRGGSVEQFRTPEWKQAYLEAKGASRDARPAAERAASQILGKPTSLTDGYKDVKSMLNLAPPAAKDVLLSHPDIRRFMEAEENRGNIWMQPKEQYLSLTGEVEARLAQRRAAMTPQELRAKPPWTMFPIAREQQIVIPQFVRQNP